MHRRAKSGRLGQSRAIGSVPIKGFNGCITTDQFIWRVPRAVLFKQGNQTMQQRHLDCQLPSSPFSGKQLTERHIVYCCWQTWNLRDAFFVKARLMLPELSNAPGLQTALPAIVDAIKVGLDDKIAQVFFSCLALIESLLSELATEGAPKAQVAPMLDGVIHRLLAKLTDGQVRSRF